MAVSETFITQANDIFAKCRLITQRLASVSEIVRQGVEIIETKTRLLMNNLEARLVNADADQRELQGFIAMNSPLMGEISELCEKLEWDTAIFENIKPL